MSAYVEPPEHIAALVRAAYRGPVTGRAVSPASSWTRPTWYIADPSMPGQSRRFELDHETLSRVASMLYAANVASVSYRYPDDAQNELPGITDEAANVSAWSDSAEAAAYWHRAESSAPRLSTVAALKALDGYEYQSCERPDWDGSEAEQFCDTLRRSLIRTLPGYEDAAWEVAA